MVVRRWLLFVASEREPTVDNEVLVIGEVFDYMYADAARLVDCAGTSAYLVASSQRFFSPSSCLSPESADVFCSVSVVVLVRYVVASAIIQCEQGYLCTSRLKAASSEREHDLVSAALERVACDSFAQRHSFIDSSDSRFSNQSSS